MICPWSSFFRHVKKARIASEISIAMGEGERYSSARRTLWTSVQPYSRTAAQPHIRTACFHTSFTLWFEDCMIMLSHDAFIFLDSRAHKRFAHRMPANLTTWLEAWVNVMEGNTRKQHLKLQRTATATILATCKAHPLVQLDLSSTTTIAATMVSTFVDTRLQRCDWQYYAIENKRMPHLYSYSAYGVGLRRLRLHGTKSAVASL
mmetsp:Transcript_33117/g.49021  ORF Transcript_33117/g.49021 Transcript_33117/m.49021 type:complete len:205 (-) Transcript_33117:1016-1630(-)